MRRFLTLENFVLLTIALIIINVVYLDASFIQNKYTNRVANPLQSSSDCPSCSVKIANLETQVDKLMEIAGVSVTPALTPSPVIEYVQPSSQVSSAKEYYVPFGSGSGLYTDWTDVPGLQAYIDSTAYGKIKSVVFETSLHIPTANEIASVRLVNATDGRVIAGSELDFSGSAESVFLSSSPIVLDYGQKLYKIQMKTQLQYNAVIDQTRVHITTQ